MFVHIWFFRSNGKATCAGIVGTRAETDFLQHLFHKEGGLGHQMNQFKQHWSDTAGQLWKCNREWEKSNGMWKTELHLRYSWGFSADWDVKPSYFLSQNEDTPRLRRKQTCFDYCSLPFTFQTLQPASIVPVRVVSLPSHNFFFGSCFCALAGFIRSKDAISELQ